MLIIHGDADTLPISHAEYAYEAIPGSDLFPIKGGSHIGFWVAPTALEAQEFAVKWLKEKMGV